ncbi:MAG: DUF4397 domain-containing protein [Gemmatimonadales bacterium]
MRRYQNPVLLFAATLAVSACKPEEVIQTEDIPTAGVRFVNAVPDTGSMDFRPVDIVENTHFYNVAFRSTSLLYYKNAKAGQRQFRVFMTGTSAAVASTVMADTTVTLEAGKLYTFIMWGFARSGSSPARRLTIIEDAAPDPGNQVALRLVNAASGLGAVDGKQYPDGGSAPGSATWAGVAELSASGYVLAPTGKIRYNVTPAGGGSNLFTDALALQGIPATVDIDAAPGTTVAGSAVSGFVFPRSVSGSGAPNITSPSIIFAWDRRPPRPGGI